MNLFPSEFFPEYLYLSRPKKAFEEDEEDGGASWPSLTVSWNEQATRTFLHINTNDAVIDYRALKLKYT
jgi:hypothetical protein